MNIKTIKTPVLIIGAGAAGARTAIELQENGVTPHVISKRDHGDAHTTWARGGINAALGNIDDTDSWEIHAADTLEEGHFINDTNSVEIVTKNMPDRIRELDEWGMDFTKNDEVINQRYFGAQSYPRTCFAGDHTGESLLDTLVDKAQSLNIPYQENVMITRLLSDGDEVYGAVGYDMENGEFIQYSSEKIVLAAGGSTAVYNRHSSREDENNGDGPALAYMAGATLKDMEFIQFHPTGMVGYGEEWDGRLVTEAVRGDGGYLINSEGDRFMFEYSELDRPELDARDVVARAIQSEVDSGRGTESDGVYLDISHKEKSYIKERLPRMYQRFKSIGVDISEEPMEVAPTAHYAMGGVDFDPETGETDVKDLHVVGETTAGVHGANRLGGNSLAETVAIGQVVGDYISQKSPEEPSTISGSVEQMTIEEIKRLKSIRGTEGTEDVMQVVGQLGDIMEQHAGIRREEDSLKQGYQKLKDIKSRLNKINTTTDMTSEEFEFRINLEFMVTCCEAIIQGSNKRKESRGAHYRTDYQQKHDDYRHNIMYFGSISDMSTESSVPDSPSQDVVDAIEYNHEMDYHHLE